ncbi:MAG: hypothetical protein COT91_02715 [Candidatus Doudnabacteria bacterium CG10_big_fil_rev_8_21_14_0_10_41_10]|uniref:DUF11 domain-containing protein n=1 Tax=Candidatus Doudnabacteria bacterium CG10_big_fil_rev_8_21_14_0_10_41_10 TaxID=1974551 RepID=A0A2H0VDK1_9BACT|nr:MAG: hypothetical protein COT91_02715 [Candidatus Doudnabacteria bacterium CG10_big_fil_rev_8_21_14_0_10_41_10]
MTKFIAKNSNLNKTVIAAIGLVVIASLVPAFAFADTASFNIFPISYSGDVNHDYPLLDARNYSEGDNFSTSQSDHDNGVDADPGDTVEFVIYYHNGAANSDDTVAENVKIRAFLPSGKSQTHSVSAQISSDDTSTVSSSNKGGDVDIDVSGTESQNIEYISGSTRWYPEGNSSYQTLPDGIVTSGINIGDIRGCWDFSGFVKFQARIGEQVIENDGYLEIDKTVLHTSRAGSSFRDEVDAEPSDAVEFKIVVEARGGDIRNVIIRDILPSGLDFESGTLRIDGSSRSGTQELFGSGYNHGTLREGEDVEITFEAELASASYFDDQSKTLTNTANARGDNTSTVQDTARVRVEGQVLSSSFRLSKSAFNQTKGVNAQSVLADSGDVINYTLTYENTGDITARNVVIEDDLYDVLLSADLINNGGGNLVGNTIRYPAVTVSAGVSVSKTFQVRVRAISDYETNLTMTNYYGNQIDVPLRPPTVKGIYIAPKSGPASNVVLLLSLLTTGVLYARKKYPKLKSLV